MEYSLPRDEVLRTDSLLEIQRHLTHLQEGEGQGMTGKGCASQNCDDFRGPSILFPAERPHECPRGW